MALTYEYSENWKNLGSVLLYKSLTFQFHSSVVIVDFEGCLIAKLPTSKLYHAIDPKTVTSYNDNFLKLIKEDAIEHSLVVISNTPAIGRLAIDSLKRKVEIFLEKHNIPILFMFALKKNRLSKPHTGMYDFLKVYFKKFGDSSILRACVISDNGGRIIERELRNKTIKIRADNTDVDRAFANNLGVPYHTINEYLNSDLKEKFHWNSHCLSPEERLEQIELLSKCQNPNIFAKMGELGRADTYMIMLMGAPRCGKTTLARELLATWRGSKWGKTHAIKRFGRDKYTKSSRITQVRKTIEDHISVIIDGDTHTADMRAPFEEIAEINGSKILYVEVNPGNGLANIFNHIVVETSTDENIEVIDIKEYHYYKSQLCRPPNVVLCCPQIKKTKEILEYRF